MILKEQIISFIFSFIFGIFYFISFCLIKKYLLLGKLINKIVYNFIFYVFNVFIYFSILYIINKGVLHIYLLISFILGVLLGFLFTLKKCKDK